MVRTMSSKKVTVSGPSPNRYHIRKGEKLLHVYRITLGVFGDSETMIGKAATLDDALALIRARSGQTIVKIE